jgi:hypothetical protein
MPPVIEFRILYFPFPKNQYIKNIQGYNFAFFCVDVEICRTKRSTNLKEMGIFIWM